MKNIISNLKVGSKVFGLFAGLVIYSSSLLAQQDLPFQTGEQLNFTIRYKYGIVMVKAGTAQYAIKDYIFREKPAIRTSLTFRTTGVVDAAYSVKDTLYSYFTPELIPVFHRKYLNEGKTHYKDEIDYKIFSANFTSVQSKRIRNGNVRFDTLLTTNGFGYDPVFYDSALGTTAACLSKEEKNSRSHRAKAVQALLREWPAFWRAWMERIG